MRWGLIGASNIAASHIIAAIRKNGGSIRSVLSADPARSQAYASEHGIDTGYSELDRMLAESELDAVYISTTNEKHFPQAMAAIAAGKHVLCEKPLAMNVADAVTMVRAASQSGLILGTNHHLRNAGSHLAIRDLIQTGRIGTVQSVRVFHAVQLPKHLQGWRIDNPAAGGGVIADITVHDADTVRFHLGEDPDAVVAMSTASGLGKGVEDSVMSVWSMPSGVQVMAHESFTHRFAGTGIEFHGSLGSIFAPGVMSQRHAGEITLVTADGAQTVSFSGHDLYERAVALFTDAVAGKGAPAADGRDGIASLAVAEAVAEAARSGRRITVDYGDL